jgi:hypothetical protein
MSISGIDILQRIRGLLPEGRTLRGLAAETGIPAATVYSWGQNDTLPKAVDLLTIADHLGVSMRLLLTGRDEGGLDTGETELIGLYRTLPPDLKSLVLGLARLAANTYKE